MVLEESVVVVVVAAASPVRSIVWSGCVCTVMPTNAGILLHGRIVTRTHSFHTPFIEPFRQTYP